MDWFYYFLLLALLFIGWFVNLLGLPGLWLMVAAVGGYGLFTGWSVYVGWTELLWMIGLAVAAEIVEFVAGAAGSKSAGGRKRGMFGAIVGGVLGGILLTGLIPIPIVGTIVGACLGSFIGAAVMEFSDRDAAHAMRVGVGAARGRFWGIVSKLGFGFIMLGLAMWTALPFSQGAPVTPFTPATPTTPAPPATTTIDTDSG